MKVRPTLPLVVVVVGLLASALTPRMARSQQMGAGQAAPLASGLYYALVIGNGDYGSLPKLDTAARDARAVERVLRESYGFQTNLLINATRVEIVAALSGYRRKLSADASLLVYYAGHGSRDAKTDKAYWLPVDATREDMSHWLDADEITTGLRVIPARHVLVLSDSCYSGTLTIGVSAAPPRPSEREQFRQKMAAARSRTLMASGGDKPLADGEGGSHSVFASALLRGLREMDGPRFTASELFGEYVIESVAGRAGLIPVYNPLRDSGHENGDFVFERTTPPDTTPCAEIKAKAALYQKFLDNFKGGPEQQKVAYETGKEFIARYGDCPKTRDREIADFIRSWMGKYEHALRIWERSKGRQP